MGKLLVENSFFSIIFITREYLVSAVILQVQLRSKCENLYFYKKLQGSLVIVELNLNFIDFIDLQVFVIYVYLILLEMSLVNSRGEPENSVFYVIIQGILTITVVYGEVVILVIDFVVFVNIVDDA